MYLLWMIVVGVEFLRTRVEYVRNAFLAVMNGIIRDDERDGRPTAAPAMVTGLVLAWWIAPAGTFWLCVICVACVDPAARLVGIHYGLTPFPGAGKKTCEGFLGAWIAGAFAASASGCVLPLSTVIGFVAAIGEIIGKHEPWWQDDNLFIPVFVSIALRLL
jgi:dolichol kinase